MPVSFHNIITAWDSVPKNQQTLENLLPLLMKEEKLRKSFGELKIIDNEESVALYAKKIILRNLNKLRKHLKVNVLIVTRKGIQHDNA